MTLRYAVAYGLIAIMVLAAILGVVIYRRQQREDRRMRRGDQWRKR